MRLVVSSEARFCCGRDGTVRCDTGTQGYPLWARYLDVFDSVDVVARVLSDENCSGVPVEGPGVRVLPLPHYVGPRQFLRQRSEVLRRIRAACDPPSAVILHSGAIGDLFSAVLHRSGHPYGLEVVGDPHDVFSPDGGVRHPLRPFFRWWFTSRLQRQCRDAAAVSYVTETALQRRYPAGEGSFSISCSDVMLPDEAFAPQARRFSDQRAFTIVTVGSMAQMYKGLHFLLQALRECIDRGLDVKLVLVGDGAYRNYLEDLASTLKLDQRVVFTGYLQAGQAVRDQLDRADLFVLPSLTEGLPRSLLEAMARGLPCIGSSVGGIPELLTAQDRVAPGDVSELATRLCEVLSGAGRMNAMAERSLARARCYREASLRDKRALFLREIKSRTDQWLASAQRTSGC